MFVLVGTFSVKDISPLRCPFNIHPDNPLELIIVTLDLEGFALKILTEKASIVRLSVKCVFMEYDTEKLCIAITI